MFRFTIEMPTELVAWLALVTGIVSVAVIIALGS